MKLRIKGNSIRLRLLRSEVERFGSEGIVSEETRFGGTRFRYSLRRTDVSAIAASFDNGEITVHIPERVAHDWVSSNEVGLEKDQDGLSILIEKDFVCLDRPGDPDRHDAYPNPQLACGNEA